MKSGRMNYQWNIAFVNNMQVIENNLPSFNHSSLEFNRYVIYECYISICFIRSLLDYSPFLYLLDHSFVFTLYVIYEYHLSLITHSNTFRLHSTFSFFNECYVSLVAHHNHSSFAFGQISKIYKKMGGVAESPFMNYF